MMPKSCNNWITGALLRLSLGDDLLVLEVVNQPLLPDERQQRI